MMNPTWRRGVARGYRRAPAGTGNLAGRSGSSGQAAGHRDLDAGVPGRMNAAVAAVKSGPYRLPGGRAQPRRDQPSSFPPAGPVWMAGVQACPWCSGRAGQPEIGRATEIVCQGVRMIVAGALDGEIELELATRLGVSQRHLRRLFHAHLGVTGDQLARFHRAHRARRLLEDSAMSVTEIASAAGYGSLRQLNRSFQQVFRVSPSQLRARRRGSGWVAIG